MLCWQQFSAQTASFCLPLTSFPQKSHCPVLSTMAVMALLLPSLSCGNMSVDFQVFHFQFHFQFSDVNTAWIVNSCPENEIDLARHDTITCLRKGFYVCSVAWLHNVDPQVSTGLPLLRCTLLRLSLLIGPLECSRDWGADNTKVSSKTMFSAN